MARAGSEPAGESTVRSHSPPTAALIAAGVRFGGLAAPGGVAEPFRGHAPEPGLHRLLKRLVRKARAHPPCAASTRAAPRRRTSAPP